MNFTEQELKEERWADITDYVGVYKISSLGRILSLNYKNKGIIRLRKIGLSKNGYGIIRLALKGIHRTLNVHRLVTLHFLPNPENKKCTNHINSNRFDNRLSNLEWATHSENQLHSYYGSIHAKPADHSHVKTGYRYKLTEEQEKEIIDLYSTGKYLQKQIALRFNISTPLICTILKKGVRKNVRHNYNK